MQLMIHGIEVTVTRKNIKNMHLYVKPPEGRVEVSAPAQLSRESIERFVCTRLDWIRRQQAQFSRQPRQTAREYVSGESLYVWGRQYYLLVNHSDGAKSLALEGDRAVLTVPKDSTLLQRSRFVAEWYRKLLKAEIRRQLPKWEQRTGQHPEGWQIRNMRTRWGSCSPNSRRICLNLQLAKKHPECLDYVLALELVSLSQPDSFQADMDRLLPNWRQIRQDLNCQILDPYEG